MAVEMDVLMAKARECLDGAECGLANRRFNNGANRAYYACYQAAIVALTREGIQASGDQWSHQSVPAAFEGILINRRKVYPTILRGTLHRTHVLRLRGDYYAGQIVTEAEPERAVRRARAFVAAVQERTSGRR